MNPGLFIQSTITLRQSHCCLFAVETKDSSPPNLSADVSKTLIGHVEGKLRLVKKRAVFRVRTRGVWGENPGFILIIC
jgi:hypothetical protein